MIARKVVAPTIKGRESRRVTGECSRANGKESSEVEKEEEEEEEEEKCQHDE